MSTRSLIGIQNEDETINYISCFFEGYPEHNGKMLLEHYDIERTRKLVALGDICDLGEYLSKEDKEENKKGENDNGKITHAFHRDEGEELRLSTCSGLDKFRRAFEESLAGYAYLLAPNGQWELMDGGNGNMLKPLFDYVKIQEVLQR